MEENTSKNAGVIIVGDEILKGQVKDINSNLICKKFRAIGIMVRRIVTVPDIVDEIADEVGRLSKKYDIVITTGGIGPTHDDVTYEGVASAVGDKIVLNPEMAEIIRRYFPGGLDLKSNPVLKMALIPESSKLIYVYAKQKEMNSEKDRGSQNDIKTFPIVQVKNVYVLPGMTEWLNQSLNHLEKMLEIPNFNVFLMTMFIKSPEVKILDELNKALGKFQNCVSFGSYPSNNSISKFLTKVTVESSRLEDAVSAYSYLNSLLPSECINNDLDAKDAELVYDLINTTKALSGIVKNSLEVIESAFKKYQSSDLYLSFNGGKDCTALLHLVWAVNKVRGCTNSINTVYIRPESSFPEVDKFIAESTLRYSLNVVAVSGPIKKALNELHTSHPDIKAIFMGTRRTDPHSGTLHSFQMCDEDWPPLVRVSPILDWSYQDVWNFLRILHVPYCSLYDAGYTSIGNPENTVPNPALKISSMEEITYLPAYKLEDDSLERQGRS